jgi:hypothetical protein
MCVAFRDDDRQAPSPFSSRLVGAGPIALAIALLGSILGGTIGWRVEPAGASHRVARGRLWLRGEWWSLVQIAVVLIFRYVTNVVAIMNPVLNAETAWHLGSVVVSMTLASLFLGRTTAKLKSYFSSSKSHSLQGLDCPLGVTTGLCLSPHSRRASVPLPTKRSAINRSSFGAPRMLAAAIANRRLKSHSAPAET